MKIIKITPKKPENAEFKKAVREAKKKVAEAFLRGEREIFSAGLRHKIGQFNILFVWLHNRWIRSTKNPDDVISMITLTGAEMDRLRKKC